MTLSWAFTIANQRLALKVLHLEKGKVYTSGCLKELVKCINWQHPLSFSADGDDSPYDDIYSPLTTPTVMYVTYQISFFPRDQN